jgi:hypothetical protein
VACDTLEPDSTTSQSIAKVKKPWGTFLLKNTPYILDSSHCKASDMNSISSAADRNELIVKKVEHGFKLQDLHFYPVQLA